MSSLIGDLRYGLRTLARNRGFAAAAILTLGLGIGANTAIFSVVDAVLLRPLPYPDPERLVWGWGRSSGGIYAAVSPPDFLDYRERNTVFERVSAMTVRGVPLNLLGEGGDPLQVTGVLVTSGFFETLGVAPALGRTFSRRDEDVALPESVVLSYGLWARSFGKDPELVGKSIRLDGRSVVVLGVMPEDFGPLIRADLWEPTPMRAPDMQGRGAHQLRLIGRLAPGVSVEQAQAGLDAVALELERQYPDSNGGWGVRLVTLHELIVGGTRPSLLLLLGAVALVLLIACANLANLLFARAAARSKEIAIRAAIGASRARLVRQLLTENLLLSFLGGGLGLVVALWGLDALRGLGPAGIPRLAEATVNARVLAATAIVSLVTGLLFGLAPAVQTTQRALQERLSEGGRTGASQTSRWRGALIVAEVSLSLMLLVGAGLLIRSLSELMRVDPGFRPGHLVTTRLHLPIGGGGGRYDEGAARARFYGSLLERVAEAPEVEAAGAVTELPLSGQHSDTLFTIEGRPSPPDARRGANFRVVSRDYFRTMGIALRTGRTFDSRDTAGAPGAVIINEPMARAFFPDASPLGQRLVIDMGKPLSAEIVGVVEGVRHGSLAAPAPPEMFIPYDQFPTPVVLNLVVRSRTSTAAAVSALRGAVRAIDPTQPLGEVRTLDEIVATSIAQPRFRTLLLALFAGAALLLAAVGIYGLLSWTVVQRTREIGVRMALGAGRRDILGLMIGRGMKLTAAGIVLGLVGALATTRLLTGLLFGVAPADPLTFIGVSVVLAATAFAACYLPARRAAKVDPMIALRYE